MPKKIVKKPVASEVVKGEKDSRVSKPLTIIEGQCRIGLSKGITLNLGNYESARLDFWMEKVVDDSESSIDEALIVMSNLIDIALEEEATELKIKRG